MGAYNVRLKAKPGYAAGSPTTITVSAPNQNQAAPTGLAGVAPTYVYGGGKITGITSLMEYKLLSEPDSNYKDYTEGTTVIAGSYAVRYKARTGYNAGAAATIVVPPFVNANQAAPTGLTTTPTTRATGNDGKINGWTADMEYKLSGSGIYTQCEDYKMNYLYAGTYLVRLKAKTGFNAGADATVVITAPAAKNDATL